MKKLRYPAVPLITVDPYFSIWSCSDNLYDDVTRHWTGRRQNFLGMIEIDNNLYRFMGKINADNFRNTEPFHLEQTDVTVLPMKTIYTFENNVIRLTVTFMTPLICDDLALLSRPISYISYHVESLDKKIHNVRIYFYADCSIASEMPGQSMCTNVYENGICVGRENQEILEPTGYAGDLEYGGDEQTINWGWLHIFGKNGFSPMVKTMSQLRNTPGMWRTLWIDNDAEFAGESFILDNDVIYIGLEKEFELKDLFEDFLCLGYDDIYSIKYFGKKLCAYYKKDGSTFDDVCKKALLEYEDICFKVDNFENKLLSAADKISDEYKDIISLAYRQAIAAHKLTWDGEELLFLSKECFSNGCIGTLDITYPSSPLFLMLNPKLVEGMLNPIFKFANSEKWTFDFAPHDVGQYPIAGGQIYGIDENGMYLTESQMPVEECGNALLCVYAICYFENDYSYFEKHRAILHKWAHYLIDNGFDPENQLCTDDFAGHLAHNCNLAAKAIMAIAAYGKLLEAVGNADAEFYISKSKEYAHMWKEKSFCRDHYKLVYDDENTWSIKYNMVWDVLYDWNIFDKSIIDTEINYYLNKFNKYGLPLDSRADYTKTDWLIWTMCMTDNAEYRQKIVGSIWKMLNETPNRVPFTDLYFTSTAIQRNFQNRSVQGGLFMPIIKENLYEVGNNN